MVDWRECIVPLDTAPERPWQQSANTLCWCCLNAYGGCSWSRKEHLPVEGWKAIRRDIPQGGKYRTKIESYAVMQCPEFAADGRFAAEYRYFSCKKVRRLARGKR